MEVVIDKSKWLRNQYTDKKAEGDTSYHYTGGLLLNGSGSMCCLGFCALLQGATNDQILNKSMPRELGALLPGLTEATPSRMFGFSNTLLSRKASAINDDPTTTDEQKIDALTKLFNRNGHTIKFIDPPVTHFVVDMATWGRNREEEERRAYRLSKSYSTIRQYGDDTYDGFRYAYPGGKLLRPSEDGPGTMCCLGFCVKQMGATDEEIAGKNMPASVKTRIFPGLSKVVVEGGPNVDTQFSKSAAAINDNGDYTDADKIQRLTQLFQANGYTIEFIDSSKPEISTTPNEIRLA